MRKKLPAGLVIVIAVLFMMTAVAAAVTNGFGLLRYYPDQAENTAFTDRIVSIGQTWEGKAFSAEIKEAVFDGYKLRFSMSVTPGEGTGQFFVYPVIKAVCGEKELIASSVNYTGRADSNGFWVPDKEPPVSRGDFDLNNMVYEIALMDSEYQPKAVSEDVEWTITFNVLRTDWKVSFADSGFGSENWSEQLEKAFREKQYEAYDRQELLLDEYGYGMDDIIGHQYVDVDNVISYEGDIQDYYLTLYTRSVFTQEEQAVFSFVADRAEVRKAEVPVKFVLPEKQKCEIRKAEATADGVNVIVWTRYFHMHQSFEIDEVPWSFKVKSDEADLNGCYTTLSQRLDDYSGVLETSFTLEYDVNKPVSSIIVIPVQNTDSGQVEREDLAVVIALE